MNAVARSFGARALSFVPTAVATLLASRLIIENYGLLAFNAFALILSLINLIPLNDLGVGAAITSALAEHGARSGRAARTVLTATRVMAVSAGGTAVLAMVIAAFGLWEPLLGASSGPDLWVGLSLVIYALTFLPGLGQSMLLGVHRNHTTIFVQTLFNPLNALIVAAIVLSGSSANLVVLVPCVSLLVVNLITAAIAGRATGISWRRVIRQVPGVRRHPGERIRAMSGPVLLITLSTPIALQCDRIVLSHVSSATAVAEYSVALQIFGPALVLIAATSQPLWPIWAQARAAGRRGPGVLRVVTLFALGGVVVGAVLALLAGPVARLVAGSAVEIPPLLAFAGALGVITAALSHPVAMSLMYPAGVKIVAWCTVLALPLNVGLSILLARDLGAAGPLFASCIAGILVQALPGLVISARRQRRVADMPAAPVDVEDEAGTARPGPGVTVPGSRGASVPMTPVRRFARHSAPETPVTRVPEPALAGGPRRPRPFRTEPAAATQGRHSYTPDIREQSAAAALAMSLSGNVERVAVVPDYPPAETAHGADVRLQPVAPFRRPRDRHRSHRDD